MKINFYATLRPIVGQKTVEFPVPEEVTVAQLVELVITRYPALGPELLNESGQLYPHVHLFVNGRDAPYLENATDTTIRATDKIDIFPAVGGGESQKTDERVVRGIPLWLLREYLEEIGGKADGERKVIGKGWIAHLSPMEPFKIGSLRVGQVKMLIEGDEETLTRLQPVLEKKTMRAGA